jgi:hypothetical protein
MKQQLSRQLWTIAIVVSSLLFILTTGCEKKSVTEVSFIDETVSNEEIAFSIASSIGENTGGALDQFGDVLDLASTENTNVLWKTSDAAGIASHTATYDSIGQMWVIYVVRERGNPSGPFYAYFERTYNLQFLNQYGDPQKHWITDSDTAYSVIFKIVDGDGRHLTPRLSQELKAISGNWLLTDTNLRMVTMNGSYYRAAVDTVLIPRGTRISDHTLNLTFTDVVGPRHSRRDLSKKVSGIVSGTYTATVTIITDNVTITKEIQRNIYIVLGSNEMTVQVNSECFRFDPQTGDLKN